MTPASPSSRSPSDAPESRYQQAVDEFVEFWGAMASNWGINRTMAQIHALLYCADEPLNTDDIMERLEISRGNANMNLRSLVDWNLVWKERLAHSRKDFYVAEKDVWKITAQIIRERERREIQPVQQQLHECRATLAEADTPCTELPERDAILCERFDRLIQLVEVFEGFSEAVLPFVEQRNAPVLRQFIEMAQAVEGSTESAESTFAEEDDGS